MAQARNTAAQTLHLTPCLHPTLQYSFMKSLTASVWWYWSFLSPEATSTKYRGINPKCHTYMVALGTPNTIMVFGYLDPQAKGSGGVFVKHMRWCRILARPASFAFDEEEEEVNQEAVRSGRLAQGPRVLKHIISTRPLQFLFLCLVPVFMSNMNYRFPPRE